MPPDYGAYAGEVQVGEERRGRPPLWGDGRFPGYLLGLGMVVLTLMLI